MVLRLTKRFGYSGSFVNVVGDVGLLEQESEEEAAEPSS